MARAGRQALLQHTGSNRLAAYALDGSGRLTGDEILARTKLTWRVDDEPPLPEGLVAGPFALPPGQYEVTVQLRPDARASGAFWLRYDSGPTEIAAEFVADDGPTVMTIDLPLGLDLVWVGASTVSADDAASIVEVRPVHIVPTDDRLAIPDIRTVRWLDGPGQYLFVLDEGSYQEPERWWVQGDETVPLLISPNGARRLSVAVRRGLAGGETTVKVGELVQQTDMSPGRRWRVAADLTGTETVVPVSVGCSGGFRPNEVNAESEDWRHLGCSVTVDLLPRR
jgi:hypothetical protein